MQLEIIRVDLLGRKKQQKQDLIRNNEDTNLKGKTITMTQKEISKLLTGAKINEIME